METSTPLQNTVIAADVEIPLTQEVPIQVIPTVLPMEQPQPKVENVEFPPWMIKMMKRQDFLNRKYEHAHKLFAQAYNDFLKSIDEINFEHDTNFTFAQAAKEYKGYYAQDAFEDDDEDED